MTSQHLGFWKFLLGCFAVISLARAETPDPTLLSIETGQIRGQLEGDVLTFKGIPYAEPPLGELRWRAPVAPRPWTDVRDTLALQANCVQLPIENTSEDCLYLNVWRPAAPQNQALPVLIWIQGGALVREGGSLYSGENLARKGLLVVSLNYRLGRLGFFEHPAISGENPGALHGNYGFFDQLAALKWVQRNIASFGGDPQQVTLAGESAAGGSVLVHLTSPLSRGLFQRAILQSPAVPSARAGIAPLRSLADAQAIGEAFARARGIDGIDAATARALRALPASALAAGTEGDAVITDLSGGTEVLGAAGSILDGNLIPEEPELILREGRQAKVAVLVGANDRDLPLGQAKSQEDLFAFFGPLASKAREIYDPQGTSSLDELIQAVFADRSFLEPTRRLAEWVSLAAPAYLYRFSYVPEAQRPIVKGAEHATELPFTFDLLPLVLKGQQTENDLAMAQALSAYWVAFVKTGDPNGEGRPRWNPYQQGRDELLDFRNEGIRVGADPWKARLDLWQSIWEPEGEGR